MSGAANLLSAVQTPSRQTKELPQSRALGYQRILDVIVFYFLQFFSSEKSMDLAKKGPTKFT